MTILSPPFTGSFAASAVTSITSNAGLMVNISLRDVRGYRHRRHFRLAHYSWVLVYRFILVRHSTPVTSSLVHAHRHHYSHHQHKLAFELPRMLSYKTLRSWLAAVTTVVGLVSPAIGMHAPSSWCTMPPVTILMLDQDQTSSHNIALALSFAAEPSVSCCNCKGDSPYSIC